VLVSVFFEFEKSAAGFSEPHQIQEFRKFSHTTKKLKRILKFAKILLKFLDIIFKFRYNYSKKRGREINLKKIKKSRRKDGWRNKMKTVRIKTQRITITGNTAEIALYINVNFTEKDGRHYRELLDRRAGALELLRIDLEGKDLEAFKREAAAKFAELFNKGLVAAGFESETEAAELVNFFNKYAEKLHATYLIEKVEGFEWMQIQNSEEIATLQIFRNENDAEEVAA
jgi:hypothetical protein